ncbi:MAG: citrate synthase [Bacilli bacterium]|nr:citrate synthase [Bacilli bacterium]
MSSLLDREFERLLKDGYIDGSLYEKHNVKRGLRNANGTGVLVGLTKVADVKGYDIIDDKKIPAHGHLLYRGVDLYDLAFTDKDLYGFEKTIFLLLFGHTPNEEESAEFRQLLADNCELPKGFIESVIMKNASKDIMNSIQKSILSLYSFDDEPDTNDPKKLVEKGISLIAKMPAIVAYSYQAKKYYLEGESFHICPVNKEMSLAESMLYLARGGKKYSYTEADSLDTAFIVHADHGGGNNSAFTGIVVASTSTDIYSDITASLCSLKGPRHGGANRMVKDMMDASIKEIGVDASDEEISKLIDRILAKDFYDKSGLVYGIGHAVYTLSDPRCILLKQKCESLSQEEKCVDKFNFYSRFEKIASEKLTKKNGKPYAANVDFYSGFAYEMLGIPCDLYTPIFAAARIAGWVAHIVETVMYCNKIIRPAFMYVGGEE